MHEQPAQRLDASTSSAAASACRARRCTSASSQLVGVRADAVPGAVAHAGRGAPAARDPRDRRRDRARGRLRLGSGVRARLQAPGRSPPAAWRRERQAADRRNPPRSSVGARADPNRGVEHLARRTRLGQHVDDAAAAAEARGDDRFEELDRDDDAAERDPLVVGGRRRESGGASFRCRRGAQAMDRERRLVVDPDDRLALVVATRARKRSGRPASCARRAPGVAGVRNAASATIWSPSVAPSSTAEAPIRRPAARRRRCGHRACRRWRTASPGGRAPASTQLGGDSGHRRTPPRRRNRAPPGTAMTHSNPQAASSSRLRTDMTTYLPEPAARHALPPSEPQGLDRGEIVAARSSPGAMSGFARPWGRSSQPRLGPVCSRASIRRRHTRRRRPRRRRGLRAARRPRPAIEPQERPDDRLEERHRDVDAAVGNAPLGRVGRRQPLEPALLRIDQADAVHRHGGGVVDPDDVLAARRSFPACGEEAAGGSGLLVLAHAASSAGCRCPATESSPGVAPSRTGLESISRPSAAKTYTRASRLSRMMKGRPRLSPRIGDPVGDEAGVFGGRPCGEIARRERRAARRCEGPRPSAG